MLIAENLTAGYSGQAVVHGVTISVDLGQVVTLIGANGAGKSTCLKAIVGLVRPMAGRVEVGGVEPRPHIPPTMLRLGVAMVPEGRGMLAGLSVRENLLLGAYGGRGHHGQAERMKELDELFPLLSARQNLSAGLLSGGEQQMLALARALMSNPSFLLLDEPSMGLAPIVVKAIAERIRDLAARGIGVLLVEQNAQMALAISDYGYVLKEGRIALEGRSQELRDDPSVRGAYLGWRTDE